MLPFEAPRRIVLDERLCLAATPSVGYLAGCPCVLSAFIADHKLELFNSCHLQLALQLAMQGSVSVWVGHVLVALPVFARCIQSQLVAPAINGISTDGAAVRIAGRVLGLGTADTIVHHVHAFTIHVTALILLKGLLFARGSRTDSY